MIGTILLAIGIVGFIASGFICGIADVNQASAAFHRFYASHPDIVAFKKFDEKSDKLCVEWNYQQFRTFQQAKARVAEFDQEYRALDEEIATFKQTHPTIDAQMKEYGAMWKDRNECGGQWFLVMLEYWAIFVVLALAGWMIR